MDRIPEPEQLTRPEVERLLELYGGRAGQDRLILAAARRGISAQRMQVLAGIARTTVAAVLKRHGGTRPSV